MKVAENIRFIIEIYSNKGLFVYIDQSKAKANLALKYGSKIVEMSDFFGKFVLESGIELGNTAQ